MPSGENYYVIDFQNPAADGGAGHPHFMIFSLDATASLKKYLGYFLMSHPQLVIDVEKKYPFFPNKPLAQAKADELRDGANSANPDRVGAEVLYPDAANRILEVGKPAADVLAADKAAHVG